MPGAPEGPSAGAPAVTNAESSNKPSGIEIITTPITPETTKSPFEISQEGPLSTVKDTEENPARDLVDSATTKGISNTFEELSKDEVIEDNSPTPTKNEAAFASYRDLMSGQDATKDNTDSLQNPKDQSHTSPAEPNTTSQPPIENDKIQTNVQATDNSTKNTGAADGTLAQIHGRLDANPALKDTLTELQNINQQLDTLRASKNPNDQQELTKLELKKTDLTAQYNKQSEAPQSPASPPEPNTTTQPPTIENKTPDVGKDPNEEKNENKQNKKTGDIIKESIPISQELAEKINKSEWADHSKIIAKENNLAEKYGISNLAELSSHIVDGIKAADPEAENKLYESIKRNLSGIAESTDLDNKSRNIAKDFLNTGNIRLDSADDATALYKALLKDAKIFKSGDGTFKALGDFTEEYFGKSVEPPEIKCVTAEKHDEYSKSIGETLGLKGEDLEKFVESRKNIQGYIKEDDTGEGKRTKSIIFNQGSDLNLGVVISTGFHEIGHNAVDNILADKKPPHDIIRNDISRKTLDEGIPEDFTQHTLKTLQDLYKDKGFDLLAITRQASALKTNDVSYKYGNSIVNAIRENSPEDFKTKDLPELIKVISGETKIDKFSPKPDSTAKTEKPSQEQKAGEKNPENKPTPEEAAKKEAISYFSKHLDKWQQALNDPNIENVGGDFAITKYQAYIKQTQEGKFFDEIKVSGTFDGNPIDTTQKSPYEFFKGIANTTEQRAEAFKNNPKLVEQERIEGAEAKKIADTMEKLKPAKDETSPKQEDVEKGDEKNEAPKSENEKPKTQMDEITYQFKQLNPNYDPQNDKDFLNKLAENPQEIEITKKILDFQVENKKFIENNLRNSDVLKNLGINPSEVANAANKAMLENLQKQLHEKVEKSNQELANNPDPQKQKENEADSILLKLLKAMGAVLVAGGAAVMAAGKEMTK